MPGKYSTILHYLGQTIIVENYEYHLPEAPTKIFPSLNAIKKEIEKMELPTLNDNYGPPPNSI